VVCCLSVTFVYCAQTAETEQIEMPFSKKTRGALRHIVLKGVGVGIPHGKG